MKVFTSTSETENTVYNNLTAVNAEAVTTLLADYEQFNQPFSFSSAFFFFKLAFFLFFSF